MARRSAVAAAVPVSRLVADATARLPAPDASFDTVVDTSSLCTFGAPAVTLAEGRRVLRRGRRVLLLTHMRARAALDANRDVTAGAVAAASEG